MEGIKMQKSSRQAQMILNDNLWKVMIKLTLPAIVAMGLHGLNVIFDAIFVGKFVGELALSGISVAYPLAQIALGIGSMIGGGAGAYLSIVIGEKDTETQNKILGNANLLGLVLSIFLMILLFITAKPLLSFMGGKGEVLEIALSYFRITVIGMLFWILSLAYNMIIRAEGKMGKAALIMGTGLVVNIVANYILMVVFRFGVVGAAWGTNLGMFVYTILQIMYFKSGKTTFKTKVFALRRDSEIMKKIIALGMPQLIMSITGLLLGMVILNAIGAVGTDYDLAFYGVSFRIMTFMMMPINAFMRSLQPVVGMNFGAKKYDRVISAVKIYILGALIVIAPIYLWVVLNPQSVLGLMFEGAISPENIFNFIIFMSVIPLFTVTMNGMSYFPAIGESKIASTMPILRQFILYIPAMIFLPRLFGVRYAYVSAFVIDVFIAIVIGILLLRSFTKLRKAMN
ncbi:MAG: MATE family efflux transporter [Tissierellia bacterium]|nr:MATE family efflux transporter [Tissierellia bacterium]